jgi:hypothetical protein
MALDTAAKRFSIMHLSCPWRMTLPLPDGTLASEDRQQLIYQCTAVGFAAPGGGGILVPIFGIEWPPIFGGRLVR